MEEHIIRCWACGEQVHYNPETDEIEDCPCGDPEEMGIYSSICQKKKPVITKKVLTGLKR